MTVVFDLDHTITAYPKACQEIAHGLSATGGHRIVILTGTELPNPTDEQHKAMYVKKRDAAIGVGFTSFDEVVVLFVHNSGEAAVEKAKYCKEHEVDIFIDDSTNYCDLVKRACPQALILQVR